MKRLSSEEILNVLVESSDENDDEHSAIVQQFIQEEERDFHAEEPVEPDDLQDLVKMALTVAGTRETTSGAAETPPNVPEEEPQYVTMDSAASSETPTSTVAGVAGVEVSTHDDDPVPSTSTGVRRSNRVQQTPRATYIASSSDEEEDISATTVLQSAPVSRRGRRRVTTVEAAVASDLHSSTKLVQPLSRRERIPWEETDNGPVVALPFKPEHPGIQVDVGDDFDELAALMLFMDDDIWNTIARETNRYYHNRVSGKEILGGHKDVTPAEARAYIGILVLLGLNPPSNIRTPWKRDSTFRIDTISNAMSFRRFIHIHNNFHLVDNATLPDKDTIAYKTCRVQPLLGPLQEKCRSVYKAATRYLSIDEGSLGWKGHCAMRVYNPNKPHKYHIKFYKLVETATGYLSNFIVHDTTPRTVDEVVLTLLDKSPCKPFEGYSVVTDRFYTSPDLYWHLRTKLGYETTGTCLPNRHQFPDRLKVGKKKPKDNIESVAAMNGDAKLTAMRWTDSKDVYMLSTEATARRVECTAQRGRVTVTKPEMVPLYNKQMGGVDLNDYLESKYSPCRAAKKMWRKLAVYLISTAVTNAYIIHRMVTRKGTVRQSAHFQFREKLGNIMLMLCDTRPAQKYAITAPIPVGLGHLPKVYPPLQSQVEKARSNPDAAAGKLKRQLHRCQLEGCKQKSIFYCIECNKCFCMRPDKECFRIYHQNLKVQKASESEDTTDSNSVESATEAPAEEEEDSAPQVQPRVNPARSAKRVLPAPETPSLKKRARKSPVL